MYNTLTQCCQPFNVQVPATHIENFHVPLNLVNSVFAYKKILHYWLWNVLLDLIRNYMSFFLFVYYI